MSLKNLPNFSEFYQGLYTKFRVDTFLTSWGSWTKERKKLSLEDLFQREGFFVKSKIGENARRLKTTYEDPATGKEKKAIFTAFLDDETRVLFCFSSHLDTNTIRKTLGRVVKSPGIYHLWMSPKSMWSVKDEVFSEYPYSRISSFWTAKPKELTKTGEIRPEYKRTFKYIGNDGERTLRELDHHYGTYPTWIEFEVPETLKFSVSNDGYYRCKEGKRPFLNLFEKILNIPLRDRGIVEKSRFEIVSVSIKDKIRRVPSLTPWSVDFSRELSYEDGEILKEKLRRNNFSSVNSEISEGSVILDATIFDEEELSIFSISVGEDQLVVAPQEDCTSESFIRFFKVVTENIDPEAECSILEA